MLDYEVIKSERAVDLKAAGEQRWSFPVGRGAKARIRAVVDEGQWTNAVFRIVASIDDGETWDDTGEQITDAAKLSPEIDCGSYSDLAVELETQDAGSGGAVSFRGIWKG